MSAIAPESINPLALPSLPLVDRRQLPNCAAVYLVLEGETVIYVGQSASLVLRWQQHHKLKQFRSRGTEIRVAWLECSDTSLLPSVEIALIDWFNPELNQTRRNKIVPIKKTQTRLQNRVKAIVESRRITPYRLWKDLGCSREVAYKLVSNPGYIPRETVLEAICRTYGLQPGDILEYVPDEATA